jgi:predicted transcriptional regulator of viral defense system
VTSLNHIEKIEEIIEMQNGTVLSSDLNGYGIPRTYLSMMVAEGKLERVGRGIYVSRDAFEDEMYALQKKYSKLIFSHETALYIHDLSDRNPSLYTATVPSGYKVMGTVGEKFKIYYIRNDLHSLGVMKKTSVLGNPITVYRMERTICDVLRSKNRMDIQIFTDALKRFSREKGIDFILLMEYAKVLKVEKQLMDYLTVLL